MKRATAAALALILLLALAACGSKTEAPAQETPAEWTREGYFTDENGNFLSVTRMEDVVDPGW